MTLSSPVQFTSLAATHLEGKPYTTMTWFDTGTGQKRSPATISQILESFCDCISSIFFFCKYCTVAQFMWNAGTFLYILWKKKKDIVVNILTF